MKTIRSAADARAIVSDALYSVLCAADAVGVYLDSAAAAALREFYVEAFDDAAHFRVEVLAVAS